ncbi:MAG: P-loop NTPase family protein [Candidatus Dormibacteria bacterium]
MMRRISVVGNSGSGKSRLAAELALILNSEHTELDAIIHQSNWVDLELDEFRRRVNERLEASSWVIDGNYAQVRDLVWRRADTVVWTDPSRRTVMTHLLRRTLARLITGRELWNGNRETWRDLLSFDPNRSVVMWAWVEHRRYQAAYQAASRDPIWASLRFIRVHGTRDRVWLLSEARAAVRGGGADRR